MQTESDTRSEAGGSVHAAQARLIEHHPRECADCWACVRHCPAHAIVIIDGDVRVLEERCVQCGACVQACAKGGFVVRDDSRAVRELLAGDRPVVAILASEYVAAMHPLDTVGVERALEAVGFAGVETTILGEELVAAAYEQVDAQQDPGRSRLRSTCPVAVAWVEQFYPQLVDALIPLAPPYVAQARLVRALYPDDAAIVYVSPCWARKDEWLDNDFDGAIDAVVGFDELKHLLADVVQHEHGSDAGKPKGRLRASKQLSLIDGFPRRALLERAPTSPALVTVRGLDEIERLLECIVEGETAPALVDMLCCEGCLDGPAVGGALSVFAKRNIVAGDRRMQRPPPVGSRALLSALPAVELRRSFDARPAHTRVPSVEEIDSVLAAGEFASRDDAIDCGSCGYDTCVAHAAAICLGHSTWELCFPLQRRLMARERMQLSRDALVDPLTGLGNRRSFDQRLEAEVSGARRHGEALSLLMIDLDRFKEINDQHGHTAGDAVLVAVGVILADALRITDVACRYGGDEFAVILPQTTKTEAWVVAEKFQLALRDVSAQSSQGKAIGVLASIGVSSFSLECDSSLRLLEFADEALYRAKRVGRNRVELATS